MPDVIIKGMEMPERCCECQFIKCGVGDWKGEFWCSAIRFEPLTNIDTRPDWCPLRPAPEGDSMMEKVRGILRQYFSIGDSYTYELTRVKEAFEIGTMTMDDFIEWGDEQVNDLIEYICKKLKDSLLDPPEGGDGDG